MPRIITYLLQSFVTFVTLMAVYMLFALFDFKGGIDGLVGIMVFQPLMGALFSVLTIIACTIVGLPIRLSKSIRSWWVGKPYIPILLGITAVVLMIVAFLPSQMHWETYWENDYEVREHLPNLYFIATGWFLLCFSILHFYPLGYILAKGKTE